MTTASAVPAPFRFLYLGDAQNGLSDTWPRVIRAAYAAVPDARLIVYAGDLLEEGYDDALWGAWAKGLGFIAASVPSLPAPGNHDLHRPPDSSDSEKVFEASPLWRAHFALPDNGPAGLSELAGQNYYVDYQGVRFIALDANPFANDDYVESERARVQGAELAWLRRVLATNPNRWTIVVQHQSLYPLARGRDYAEMRTALGAVYDQFHVDLVLMGHDHVYARTHKVFAERTVAPGEPGTIYAISVSGSKMYTVATKREALMAAVLEHAQLFQVIAIDGGRLSYESHGADGELVDAFDLTKTAPGVSIYTDRSPAGGRAK
jgi:hypothetical protein